MPEATSVQGVKDVTATVCPGSCSDKGEVLKAPALKMDKIPNNEETHRLKGVVQHRMNMGEGTARSSFQVENQGGELEMFCSVEEQMVQSSKQIQGCAEQGDVIIGVDKVREQRHGDLMVEESAGTSSEKTSSAPLRDCHGLHASPVLHKDLSSQCISLNSKVKDVGKGDDGFSLVSYTQRKKGRSVIGDSDAVADAGKERLRHGFGRTGRPPNTAKGGKKDRVDTPFL